jgi:hypothetical protein
MEVLAAPFGDAIDEPLDRTAMRILLDRVVASFQRHGFALNPGHRIPFVGYLRTRLIKRNNASNGAYESRDDPLHCNLPGLRFCARFMTS